MLFQSIPMNDGRIPEKVREQFENSPRAYGVAQIQVPNRAGWVQLVLRDPDNETRVLLSDPQHVDESRNAIESLLWVVNQLSNREFDALPQSVIENVSYAIDEWRKHQRQRRVHQLVMVQDDFLTMDTEFRGPVNLEPYVELMQDYASRQGGRTIVGINSQSFDSNVGFGTLMMVGQLSYPMQPGEVVENWPDFEAWVRDARSRIFSDMMFDELRMGVTNDGFYIVLTQHYIQRDSRLAKLFLLAQTNFEELDRDYLPHDLGN